MTEQLDLYELIAEDSSTEEDWDLGPACSLDDETCEACQ